MVFVLKYIKNIVGFGSRHFSFCSEAEITFLMKNYRVKFYSWISRFDDVIPILILFFNIKKKYYEKA